MSGMWRDDQAGRSHTAARSSPAAERRENDLVWESPFDEPGLKPRLNIRFVQRVFGHTLDDKELPLLFIWNEHADHGRHFDAGQATATFSMLIEVIHSPLGLFGSDAPFHSPPA